MIMKDKTSPSLRQDMLIKETSTEVHIQTHRTYHETRQIIQPPDWFIETHEGIPVSF